MALPIRNLGVLYSLENRLKRRNWISFFLPDLLTNMDRLVSIAWEICEKAAEQKEKLQEKKIQH